MTEYNPQEIELKILQFWEENKIFEMLREKNKGKIKFRFIDGPITANNPMGVHHAYARTLKDLYQRYRASLGYDERYQNGFDCHGLPVEVEVERELGLKTKKDIERFGIKKFIEKCKERVKKMSEIQTRQSIRLGQWMDWKNSYYTMSNNNIIHIWHFLKKCHENGWIVRGSRVLPWCIRCGTSLSQHEVAEGYKELAHTAVFLKFPIKNRKNEYLLVWTTTAWTLSSNVAAAVNPDVIYIKAKKDDKIYYLSKATAHILGDHKVLKELKGSELVDLEYTGPYDELEAQKDVIHKVVPWKDVGETDGSGIVHIAPGCGAEDYELGKELNLAAIAPLDEYGNFINGFGFLSGKNVNELLELIIDDLTKKGILFKRDKITHRYPTCWRCKEELVFRMTDEWFIKVDEIRPRMKREAKKVFWSPVFRGKLMDDWLTNMGDWNISRKRYWGLPLPFWYCECGNLTVIGSMEELKEKAIAGIEELKELHKPQIDDIIIKCPKCGKEVKRVPEVGDCWLDAGIVPYSTLNYLTDKKYWKEWFPAEIISEMREQIRLWFYSLLFMSVTLENETPYEKVLLFEKVYDEKGQEMHKTGKNIIWFDDAIEKMGADVMRWMYIRTNLTQNVLFGYSPAKEIQALLNIFYNTSKYLQTYYEAYQFELKKQKQLDVSSKWLLSKVQTVKEKVTNYLENLQPHLAAKELQDFFLNDISRFYGHIIREDIKPRSESKHKQTMLWTFYTVMLDTLKILAPFTPFLTEYLYQDFFKKFEKTKSIHLCNWPKPEKKLINKKLEEQMETAKRIIEASNSARQEKGIKLKYPLKGLVVTGTEEVLEAVKELKDVITKMTNVHEVKTGKVEVGYEVKLNYKIVGKKFGKNIKELKKLLEKQDANKLKEEIEKTGKTKISDFILTKDDLIFKEKKGEGKEFEGGKIFLEIKVTPELKKEWLIRELIRAVQAKRKELGLNITDQIILYLPEIFKQAEDIIKNATSSKIVFGKIEGEKEEFEFENKKYKFGVKK